MIGWAFDTFFAINLLILLVLLARRPVASLFGAGWAYALWLLPLLRLVMPPLVIADISPVLPSAAFLPAAGDAAAPLPSSGGLGQWVPLMLALWAGGVAVFILWQLACYRHFVRSLSASIRASYPPAFEGVTVLESRAVEGPVAIGLLEPRIVVPIDFLSRYSIVEQRLALEHERVHHRRGDLWWNSLALLVLALNWFNPLAWIAFRAFRADQELACDAEVARRAAPGERHDYANALVKSASRPGLIAACPLHSADQLKRRLKMMKHHRVTTSRTVGGALALALLLAGGLGATQSAAVAQEAKKVERKVFRKTIDKDGNVTTSSDGSLAELERKCAGRKVESKVEVGDGPQKHFTRIAICGKDGNDNPEQLSQRLAEALERARTEVSNDKEISAERRAEILARLQAEIERVRSQR